MQRTAILYEASQAVLSTFDLSEVLNRILQIVHDHFRLENGSIMLVDDESGSELYIQTMFGGHPESARHTRIPFGTGLTGTAAQLRKPIYVPDVTKDPRYVVGVESTRSELAIPLMVQDKVVGVLDCQSDELDHFDEETFELLTLFAAQASIGLQNAKLYSIIKKRAAQLEALNSLAKQTTVETSLKELLERFCTELPQSFPIDHVAVLLRNDEGHLELRARYGTTSAIVDILAVQKLLADNRRKSDLCSQGNSDASPIPSHAPTFRGVKQEVCLPLVSFGRELGVLVCATASHERIQKNDLITLESVADILATAVQNAEYVERVKQLAYRDGLTGIFNRRYFESKLIEEITRHTRYGGNVSMLMIDIDHFKTINDEFGHLLGDEVLRQVAHILQTHLRKVDIICRYGGEELTVILPSTDLSATEAVAEKLRRAIATFEFPGVARRVTVSIGVAEFPTHGATRDQIVGAADEALYMAKQRGRNQVYVAPSPAIATHARAAQG